MKANIKLRLNRLSPTDLLALSRNVVRKMTDNPNFIEPFISLEELTAKNEELAAAITEATEGSRLSRVVRNKLVTEVERLMKIQANYVRAVCLGDKGSLVSSGFELVKKRERYGVPDAPLIEKSVMTGHQGQVKLKWSTQKAAQFYHVWMTSADPADNPKWDLVAASSRVSALIDNLESYKMYWFSVSAVGASGESAKSLPAKGVAA